MATKKKAKKRPEEYLQVGPSLFMDEKEDPAKPPYQRYVTWTPKRRTKKAK